MSNDNNNTRRLAAIIFADIVGYTAMMEKGENAALQTIKRFETITRACVEKYQGEVIKNYGDGSLMLFDSTVNAVQCAYDMQIAFQDAPKVPLRIGIHVGEFVRRDNDVFGHGVNISSRIESLGVAGSVLVSKMIYDKVRNQENFNFKPLGVFDFKNVDEGMEVYALANQGITVPKASEMKGKVKETKQSLWSNPTARVVGMVGLVALLAVGGISILSKSNAQKATTETITYVNEDGVEQSRLVYNRSLSNRVLLFPPKTSDSSDENKWLSLAISDLQTSDLELDNRLSVLSISSMDNDLKSKGITDYNKISFGIKRDLASDRYVDYFIDSELTDTGGEYRMIFNLHQTSDGKKLLTKEYVNSDVYSIVDGFSADLNAFLYDKVDTQSDVPKFVDLPSRELLSGNIDAVIKYSEANYNAQVSNNFEESIKNLDQAIALDPAFAQAHFTKGVILSSNGRIQEGLASMSEGIEKSDGQSERTQLAMKTQYFLFQNDIEKATRLCKMWKDLYPQTEESYHILGTIYRMTNDFSKYQEVYEDGYDAGHKGGFLLTLGGMYTQRNEFDKAEKYFEEFISLYPEKEGEIRQLGDLYLKQGKFDKAIEYFDNRTLKDDKNIGNHITLGGAYEKKGDFSNALNSYNTGLRKAKIAQDSFDVLSAISNIKYLEGKASAYYDTHQKSLKLLSSYSPKLMADMQYIAFSSVARYKECGYIDFIDQKLKELSSGAGDVEPINWPCIMKYNYALGVEDSTLVSEVKRTCPDDLAKAMGPTQVKLLGAIEKRIASEYETALAMLSEFIAETNSPQLLFNPLIADIKIKLGDFKEASELMEEYTLTDKSSAESYVLLAKAYKGDGDIAKAKGAIQKALDLWKNAEDRFNPAQEAKELMAELN